MVTKFGGQILATKFGFVSDWSSIHLHILHNKEDLLSIMNIIIVIIKLIFIYNQDIHHTRHYY